MLLDRVRPSLQISAAKPILASLLLFFQAAPHPTASPQHFRYQRPLRVTPGTGQACAVLDAPVFTHSAPSLKDLRIYAGETEVPYAITLSEPLQQDTDEARILNLGTRAGHIVFDLAMPARPYTAVNLNLAVHDFLATADVSGSETPDTKNAIRLGTFTLFDLSEQHLSHSTTLPLSESSFPYLHIELALSSAPPGAASAQTLDRPEIVQSALVPPSREAQTLYTTLQQTPKLVQRGRETLATFQVPARVPVERVTFTLAPNFKGDFSRPVRVDARVIPNKAAAGIEPLTATEAATEAAAEAAEDDGPTSTETATGMIVNVHKVEDSREIAYQNLALATAVGAT